MHNPLTVKSVDICLLGAAGQALDSGNSGRVQNVQPHFESSPNSPAIQFIASTRGTQTF